MKDDLQGEIIERAVLVGLSDSNIRDSLIETEKSIQELELLANTAGAVVVGTAIQQRKGIDPKTYVGDGKIKEIVDACKELDAQVIIFDDELSGSQIRNIEKITDLKIIDRTLLILDIFAQRAKSKEGKLQVELAQQKYRYSRLVGMGESLSRLGGGIGTRGPGESKLESDRRHINRRIDFLKEKIEEISVRRQRIRVKRQEGDVLIIAVVGYTNAGKSTLINKLSESELYAEDMLFATLDPAVRSLSLPDGYKAILVDTVGFIRKLPHHLIEAFKSTLEELKEADIIMHVIDSSDNDMQRHSQIVEDLLEELECSAKPRITVYNKIDIKEEIPPDMAFNQKDGTVIHVSAKTGTGIDLLLNEISERIKSSKIKATILVPYNQGHIIDQVRKGGVVDEIEYLNEGIKAKVLVPKSKTGIITPYIIK